MEYGHLWTSNKNYLFKCLALSHKGIFLGSAQMTEVSDLYSSQLLWTRIMQLN